MGDAPARDVEDPRSKREVPRMAFRAPLHRALATLCLCLPPHALVAQAVTPVCDRTPQVRDAVVGMVPGHSSPIGEGRCVTLDHNRVRYPRP